MLEKKLEMITIEDIQLLVDNEVGEGRTIEYKSELHIAKGDERKEFLADVSSFANSDGGDLIFGVTENDLTHIPSSLCGVRIGNEDEFILKLESMFRDSFQPRIQSIQFRIIPLFEDLIILLIRIPRSYQMPHRVIYNGHDKFYRRNAKGKYPMDVNELRSAFLHSHELSARIETYKEKTLLEISLNRYRYIDDSYPVFVIQSLPISAFLQNENLSAIQIVNYVSESQLTPFNCENNRRITVDGVFYGRTVQRGTGGSGSSAYMCCKTNGIIEAATTIMFNPRYGVGNEKKIDRDEIINRIQNIVYGIMKYYKLTNTTTPIIISCSILNGYGFTIPTGNWQRESYGHIDRDRLLIPDIIIEDIDTPVMEMLRPIFHSIWNACGYTKCPAYDDLDQFTGFR